MDCATVRDDLLDVVYGEASEAARRRVDEHASACPACREEIEDLRRLRRGLQAWRLPPALAPTTTPRPWRPAPWLAWAASLLLAFGGGLVIARGLESRDELSVQRLLEQRDAEHRRQIELLQARAALPSDEVMRHVERLVAAAEARQAERFELQLVELAARLDGQRREDLARVNAGMALIEGRTGHDLARATELMGYVIQAAHQPRP